VKKLIGLIALAVMLSFGAGTVTFAENPEPVPTEEKAKDKKPDGQKAEPDSKDEKKDDKGGK
jgi:hypothetical protein